MRLCFHREKEPSLKLKESEVADIHQNDTVVFGLLFPTQCQRCLGGDLVLQQSRA